MSANTLAATICQVAPSDVPRPLPSPGSGAYPYAVTRFRVVQIRNDTTIHNIMLNSIYKVILPIALGIHTSAAFDSNLFGY